MVVQHVKQLLMALTVNMGVLFQVLVALLPIWFATTVPGKAVEDFPSI